MQSALAVSPNRRNGPAPATGLDDQVRFLVGWFRDTVLSAPIERLAILRLDGDLHESTAVALESLYDKVMPGGYVIVDDYRLVRCRTAEDDFLAARIVTEHLEPMDWTGVYWQKRFDAQT